MSVQVCERQGSLCDVLAQIAWSPWAGWVLAHPFQVVLAGAVVGALLGWWVLRVFDRVSTAVGFVRGLRSR